MTERASIFDDEAVKAARAAFGRRFPSIKNTNEVLFADIEAALRAAEASLIERERMSFDKWDDGITIGDIAIIKLSEGE